MYSIDTNYSKYTKHSNTFTFIYYYKYNMKNHINNILKKSKTNKNITILR